MEFDAGDRVRFLPGWLIWAQENLTMRLRVTHAHLYYCSKREGEILASCDDGLYCVQVAAEFATFEGDLFALAVVLSPADLIAPLDSTVPKIVPLYGQDSR